MVDKFDNETAKSISKLPNDVLPLGARSALFGFYTMQASPSQVTQEALTIANKGITLTEQDYLKLLRSRDDPLSQALVVESAAALIKEANGKREITQADIQKCEMGMVAFTRLWTLLPDWEPGQNYQDKFALLQKAHADYFSDKKYFGKLPVPTHFMQGIQSLNDVWLQHNLNMLAKLRLSADGQPERLNEIFNAFLAASQKYVSLYGVEAIVTAAKNSPLMPNDKKENYADWLRGRLNAVSDPEKDLGALHECYQAILAGIKPGLTSVECTDVLAKVYYLHSKLQNLPVDARNLADQNSKELFVKKDILMAETLGVLRANCPTYPPADKNSNQLINEWGAAIEASSWNRLQETNDLFKGFYHYIDNLPRTNAEMDMSKYIREERKAYDGFLATIAKAAMQEQNKATTKIEKAVVICRQRLDESDPNSPLPDGVKEAIRNAANINPSSSPVKLFSKSANAIKLNEIEADLSKIKPAALKPRPR